MVVWGCRFIFNITMFFMMIMTGQPTLTHPPRRPHWWKTNDDLLRVVFLYFGVVLSQWILSSGWTDHDGMRRNLNRWVEGVVNLPGFPWIQTDPYLSESVVVSIFCFYPYWIGDMTQSDEHMFAKGLKPPTCDSQISNRNSIRVLHKNSKVIFYTRESTIWTKSQTII